MPERTCRASKDPCFLQVLFVHTLISIFSFSEDDDEIMVLACFLRRLVERGNIWKLVEAVVVASILLISHGDLALSVGTRQLSQASTSCTQIEFHKLGLIWGDLGSLRRRFTWGGGRW